MYTTPPVYLSHCMFLFSYSSTLFPVGEHFMLIRVSDWSKDYHPESKIIIDIPSGLNFFLKNADFTRDVVAAKVKDLVQRWNDRFYKKDAEVIYICHK